jgi:NAD(P)-dependent dehydrogenase (short-subunit alcohol dehydrogenase family)
LGRLEGKVALVTGARAGLGQAVTKRFIDEGARVLAADLAIDGIDGRAAPFLCDVRNPDDVVALIAECRQRYGRLDVLCNNAGITTPATRVHETSLEDWDAVHAVNLRGAFLVLKHALGLMLEAGGGAIVNMASVAAFRATPGACAYAAAKGGLLMLTRTAALEYARDNIRVNAICPSTIQTPMVDSLPSERLEFMASRIPMGRIGTPDEVASLALFLVSDEARFITGSAYSIDGGRCAA